MKEDPDDLAIPGHWATKIGIKEVEPNEVRGVILITEIAYLDHDFYLNSQSLWIVSVLTDEATEGLPRI
jgi:hypothetical protein